MKSIEKLINHAENINPREQISYNDGLHKIYNKIKEKSTNKKISDMEEFQELCEELNIEPTKRMAGKLKQQICDIVDDKLGEIKKEGIKKEEELKTQQEENERIESLKALHEERELLLGILKGSSSFIFKVKGETRGLEGGISYTDKEGNSFFNGNVGRDIFKYEMNLNEKSVKLVDYNLRFYPTRPWEDGGIKDGEKIQQASDDASEVDVLVDLKDFDKKDFNGMKERLKSKVDEIEEEINTLEN